VDYNYTVKECRAKQEEICLYISARYMNCSRNYAATVSYCFRQKKRVKRFRETTAALQTVTKKNISRSSEFAVVIDNRS
jgi:hypothetical protein